MPEGTPITLYGRVILRSTVEVLTGLHIGAAGSSLAISGVDLPVVRDPITRVPYLPGSSLKGKMRSLTEKVLGLPLHGAGRARIHIPATREEYDASPVGRLYGVPSEAKVGAEAPARLVVRDAHLTSASRDRLKAARTDLAYTELKTEAAIDRVTAEATTRQIERLPAGSTLGPAELVFSVYESRDVADFAWVARGLALIEDDYLGGQGTRGSGKVRFGDIALTLRTRAIYRGEAGPAEAERRYESVEALLADQGSIEAWIRSNLAVPA